MKVRHVSICVFIAMLLSNCERVTLEDRAWRDKTIQNPGKMKALLDRGLDPNLESRDPLHPRFLLFTATKYRELDTVKVLLDYGADPNKRSEAFGKTALFQAAYDGSIDIAEALLAAGANVNAVDRSGNNSLREAALAGQSKMVSFLLARGIDAHARNSEGDSMFELASEYAKPSIVALIKSSVEQAADSQSPPAVTPKPE